MERYDNVFAELKSRQEGAFVPFVTLGDPGPEQSLKIIDTLIEAGADALELGIPFSDPLADGPVIQNASVTALKAGMTMQKELELVKEIRKFSGIPLIGMGYINNMLHYGFAKFVKDFKAAGMDGVIIPDVPHEESADMRRICAENDFHLAEFITPGTTEERMKDTCKDANGFIYCVSNNGVTGVKKIDYTAIGRVCETARSYTKTPLAVGFGIGSPEAAVEAAAHADAVIVGSAVVKRLLENKMGEAMELISSMRKALDK